MSSPTALNSPGKKAFILKLNSRQLALGWAMVVCGLLIFLLIRFQKGMRFETDILTLLPITEQDPVAESAIREFTKRIGRKNIFLVGNDTQELALQASDLFADELLTSGSFEELVYRTQDVGERAFYDLYFPFRYTLLDTQTREMLAKPNGGEALTRRATETLYGPMSAAVSGMLEDDPLLLFSSFLQHFPKPPSRLEVVDDRMIVTKDDNHYVLVSADLVGNAFDPAVQERVAGTVGELRQKLEAAFPGTQLLLTGVVYYAHAGTRSAKSEISTIGLGSMLGILLLVMLVFRSMRPLVTSLLPIGVGCLCAVLITHEVFGEIHILTLVFGATLVGVCIDYAFHFFCECRFAGDGWQPKRAMQHILPAISMGALTSMLGYLGLLFAPFPGLKQMAVFSCFGLLGSFATVVCWFPFLATIRSPKDLPNPPFLLGLAHRYVGKWQTCKPWILALVIVVPLSVGFWGLTQVKPEDDIRLLQNRPADLVAQERSIREWIGGVDTSRFLLVEGVDQEAMLNQLETLQPKLLQARQEGAISYFQGLHQWVPSQLRQRENQKLLAQALINQNQPLTVYLEEMGFSKEVSKEVRAAVTQTSPNLLGLKDWLSSSASAPFRHLWLGETERGVASMVLLGDVTNPAAMEGLASQPGVTYIDKVGDVSDIFSRYRKLALQWVLIAYAVIFLLLLMRYGIRKGSLMLLPPILAAIVAIAGVGLLGVTVNLFSFLALLLVLAIGIDYTIFLGEASQRHATTMMAVILSSITTILSFGLLALSNTPVLQGFGLTLLFGIATAMLLAPLAVVGEKKSNSRETL